MKSSDLVKDSVGVVLSYTEDGHMGIYVLSNISNDVSDDVAQTLIDTINGMNAMVTSGVEMFTTYGRTLRHLKEEMEFNDGAIVFEADEELEKAVAQSNVVKFDKDRLN